MYGPNIDVAASGGYTSGVMIAAAPTLRVVLVRIT